MLNKAGWCGVPKTPSTRENLHLPRGKVLDYLLTLTLTLTLFLSLNKGKGGSKDA